MGTANPLASDAGYAEAAADLVRRYESASFETCWAGMLHLFPDRPSHVLELGSGSGRDAAALARRAHDVVAVEPTDVLRKAAMALHPGPAIRWLDDSLPLLARVEPPKHGFGLVTAMAVWMHLDADERALAMQRVAELLAPRGIFLLTLRHGEVPCGRRMFAVTAEETIALATANGLSKIHQDDVGSISIENRAAGIFWSRLGFRRD